jgi:hypothetical protein
MSFSRIFIGPPDEISSASQQTPLLGIDSLNDVLYTNVGNGWNPVSSGGGGGDGTVTSVSSGNLSSLFTSSVSNASTTPSITYASVPQAANTVFGNFTSGTTSPSFSSTPTFSAANLTNFPTFNQDTTGNAATATVAESSVTAENLSGEPALPNGTTATTQATGDSSNNIATTSFVNASILEGSFFSTVGGTITGTTTINPASNIALQIEGSSTTPITILNSAMATNGFNAIVLGKSTATNGSASIIFENNATAANVLLELAIAGGSAVTIGNTGNFTVPAIRRGTFVATAGGTVTVVNTHVSAGSDITITLKTVGGTVSTAPVINTLTAGTGFTVICGAADTSVYQYTVWN